MRRSACSVAIVTDAGMMEKTIPQRRNRSHGSRRRMAATTPKPARRNVAARIVPPPPETCSRSTKSPTRAELIGSAFSKKCTAASDAFFHSGAPASATIEYRFVSAPGCVRAYAIIGTMAISTYAIHVPASAATRAREAKKRRASAKSGPRTRPAV